MTQENILQIGAHKSSNRVILAPMAGVTDKPFRDLCASLGGGLMISEMISSQSSLWSTKKSKQRLALSTQESPHWIQIAGGDPQMLSEAARFVAASGADIVDINMGCPAKKVCRKAAGSALLKDSHLVQDILQSVTAAVDIPVTLKMRTGWSPEDKNGVTIARIAEDAGIAAISVHGRTRECRFNGEAEYETIAAIKAAVSIPVIANGDIDSAAKAQAVLEYTAADAIMVGRAAQGKPWLLGDIDHRLRTGNDRSPLTDAAIKDILISHIDALHRFYGEKSGLRIARKHLGWYLNTVGDSSSAFKSEFNHVESGTEQIAAIHHYFDNIEIRIKTILEKDIAA